tara:strand:+ start:378 stop:653 length:276 start_codon:yes stop_codon:yes gene_type:complete
MGFSARSSPKHDHDAQKSVVHILVLQLHRNPEYEVILLIASGGALKCFGGEQASLLDTKGREKFISDVTDVVIPAGTYQMANQFGSRCEKL